MEKEMTLPTRQNMRTRVENLLNGLQLTALMPLELLRRYFSACLERELDLRQTWTILLAQLAFIFAAFPVSCPLLLRAVFAFCFYCALQRCRRELRRME